MKKRLISLGMSIILILSCVNTAFASEFDEESVLNEELKNIVSNQELLTQDNIKQISKELQCLEKVHVYASEITNIEFNTDNFIYVTKPSDSIVNKLDVTQLSDGGVQIDIYEDDIHNKLLYTADGTLYCDDIIVVSAEEKNSNVQKYSIQPIGYYEYVTTSCPYGRANEYSIFEGYEEQKTIPLTNEIRYLTYTAFQAIILDTVVMACKFLKGKEKTFAGICGTVLLAVFEDGKKFNPKSTNASFKAYNYLYKDGKFRINSSISCRKVIGEFYSLPNFASDSPEQLTYFQTIDHT